MTSYLRLFALQARISAAQAMAYRANFVFEGAMSVVWLAITLLPLKVLFDSRATVAGWTAPGALLVIAYFMAVRAILEGIVSPSLVMLVSQIRTGSFDYVLLKPVDAQAMISTSHYEPWRIFDLAGALAVAVYAFVRLGAAPSAGNVALGVVLFVAGLASAYSLWIVAAAAAFWLGRLDNLMYLLGPIYDVARWPIQVFPGIWRFVFTFIIPVAIMTTYPAQALLGELQPRTAIATLCGASVLLGISRLVWRTAIRNYTSASS